MEARHGGVRLEGLRQAVPGASLAHGVARVQHEGIATAHLRWLILGALGLASACAGEAEEEPGGPAGEGLQGGVCVGEVTDLGNGFELCNVGGAVHRPTTGTCASSLPRDRVFEVSSLQSDRSACSASTCCIQDSECSARPNGFCEAYGSDSGPGHCTYGCVSDSDCIGGRVCNCGYPVGQCEGAVCRTDAECGAGLACVEIDMNPGCGGRAMACQTPMDECATGSDCGDRGAFCTLAGERLVCSAAVCAVGRPFLVAGEARLAAPTPRCDWQAPALPAGTLSGTSPALRAAVASGWVQQGLMEHASVAAFARFALQLTSLGAPPELLDGAASAMLDEVRHARGCFELARRYSDSAVGPGPLPLHGVMTASDLTSVVLGSIAEGCIGETLAALEAAELLPLTEDVAARELLEQIAREEAQHALLAWRFVAWALDTGPARLRAQVATAFEAGLEASRVERVEPTEADDAVDAAIDAELPRHGLASSALRQGLRRRVLASVIAPCAKALLERPAALAASRARERAPARV